MSLNLLVASEQLCRELDAQDARILEGSAHQLHEMVRKGRLWGRLADQAEALAYKCEREAVRLTARRLEQTQ